MGSFDDTYYATAEDVLDEAEEDARDLLPPSRTLAWGEDGAVASATPWVLSSATVDFAAQGVAAGDVALLEWPASVGYADAARMGTTYLVASVGTAGQASGKQLTLRRVGLAAGVGDPPWPGADASGVVFEVRSVASLLEKASDWVRLTLHHDEAGSEVDDDERRLVAVYRFLAARYAALWATASAARSTAADIWKAKADHYAAMLSAAVTQLSGRRRAEANYSTLSVVPIDP